MSDNETHSNESSEHAAPSTRHIDAVRISSSAERPVRERCRVVVEVPATIAIDGVGSYTIMCTPCDTMALAVGFAFSEGIISSTRDINLLYCCDDDPSAIRMVLGKAPKDLPERNLIVSSSCGMCGSLDIEQTLSRLRRSPDSLQVSPSLILRVLREMKSRQTIFEQTGGTHAAAIFASDGEIVAFAEDIGRHNALDKAIGKRLLEEKTAAGCGVALSGRVSLEMVTKAANAGIELIAAVSAASSLAVEAARRANITLCGFVRPDRATVFSCERRVTGLEPVSRRSKTTRAGGGE